MKFTIAYPINHWVVTQKFGNPDPLYTKIGLNGHNGLDISALHGTPIYAAHDGIVTYAGGEAKEGVGVVVTTNEKYEYKEGTSLFKTIYWHLCLPTCHQGSHKLAVVFGQNVKRGDLIGYANNTGMSTGDHLHFGLKPVAEGEASWTWWNIEQKNGYGGAIDPEPYFTGKYATAFNEPKQLTLRQSWIWVRSLANKYGQSNKEIRQMQKDLIAEGFSIPAGATGNWYGQTQTALNAFYKKYNLSA